MAIGRQTTQQALISSKFNYLRFGVSGPMIKASQSDIGSFVRSAAYELEMGYKDLSSDVNRQCGWNGDGSLATVSATVVSSTVITCTGRESSEDGNKFLDVGMVVDIVTSAGVIQASAVTITALSGTTTATVTFDQPVSVSSASILIRSGSLNNEIQGLLYALDGLTTSIYGIDRSTYPSYQGNVVNASGGQLTLDSMQQAFNEGLRRGGAKYSAIYTDFSSLRFYQKLLTADKRYVNSVEGDGSFGAKGKFYMDFNGIAIVPDKDCPTRIFFLSEDALKFYVLSDMDFADETGSMYIAQTSTDSLEVRVRFFANLFNEQPSACSVIRNYISP